MARRAAGERGYGAAGFLPDPIGNFIQTHLVARHENEIIAALCEAVGIDGADAGRCASDESSALASRRR